MQKSDTTIPKGTKLVALKPKEIVVKESSLYLRNILAVTAPFLALGLMVAFGGTCVFQMRDAKHKAALDKYIKNDRQIQLITGMALKEVPSEVQLLLRHSVLTLSADQTYVRIKVPVGDVMDEEKVLGTFKNFFKTEAKIISFKDAVLPHPEFDKKENEVISRWQSDKVYVATMPIEDFISTMPENMRKRFIISEEVGQRAR